MLQWMTSTGKSVSLALGLLIVMIALIGCSTGPAPTATTAPTAVPAATTAPTAAPAATTAPTDAPKATTAPTDAPKAAGPMDRVTFRLSWKWKPEYAAYALIVDKGFFREQNIEVELLEGKSSNDTAISLGNKSDDFGQLNMTTMAVAVGKGVPIKSIVGIAQKTPMALISYSDKNIKKPKDIEGRSLVLTPGESFTTIWPFFAKKQGIDVSKVKIIQMDATARDRAFLDGTVDVEPIFVNNQPPLYLAQKPVDINLIADWGFNVVADGIATNTDNLRDRPDLVRRFVAALVKGYAYAREHPDEAVDAIFKRSEALKAQPREFVLENYKRTAGLLQSPNAPDKPIGWSVEADWNATLDILAESGAIPSRLPASTFFTNEFHPEYKK